MQNKLHHFLSLGNANGGLHTWEHGSNIVLVQCAHIYIWGVKVSSLSLLLSLWEFTFRHFIRGKPWSRPQDRLRSKSLWKLSSSRSHHTDYQIEPSKSGKFSLKYVHALIQNNYFVTTFLLSPNKKFPLVCQGLLTRAKSKDRVLTKGVLA